MKILEKSLIVLCGLAVCGSIYAVSGNERQPVEYYSGHTHDADGTHGAPQHSGGTNSAGCHNGSVPYHCH